MTHRTRADLGIVRPSDVDPEPWANGLGVTRVLAARSSWRVSLAEIEGRMPFSPFLGADRVLIPLPGPDLGMEIDGVARQIAPLSGAAFRGEQQVVATTGGRRTSVVNVMTRRSSGRMRWDVRRTTGLVEVDLDTFVALVVLEGEASTDGVPLPRGTVIGPAALPYVTLDAIVLRLHLLPAVTAA